MRLKYLDNLCLYIDTVFVQVYIPTTNHDDDKIEKLYDYCKQHDLVVINT